VGLAAETVETVENIVSRIERGIAGITPNEDMLNYNRVQNAAGVDRCSELIAIQE
jgi:hypothetical protein